VNFVDMSGKPFNMVNPADYRFWEMLNEVVQSEPTDEVDRTTLGFWQSIGIAKGKPFAPDERMKKILTEAAKLATPLLVPSCTGDVLGRAVDLANQHVAGVDAEIVVAVIDGPRAWRVESNRHDRVPRCPRRLDRPPASGRLEHAELGEHAPIVVSREVRS
jgi:hypothetical protein